ncbi:cytochrome P450 81C13-like [Pistacia vera]|uniref:cytochrome P450 81C13-like n=1 Tax=Pistacia vera TaxID=55513 RepID=UPI001263801D|nr:cytochrome P450 81C13-like [Pistacia vera]
MVIDLLYLVLLVSVLLIFFKLIAEKKRFEDKNHIPSPPSLPIIGHFHLLKQPLAPPLTNLSTKYGPIFFLRLGSRPTLVLTEHSVIEECFSKNDIIFSNRPLLPSRKIQTYNYSTIIAPYGNHWRNLRRFFALEIFSAKRLQMSANVRHEELRIMVKHLFKSSLKGAKKVDVKAFLYMLDFNMMMRMVAGNRCIEEEEIDTDEAKGKMDELIQTFIPDLKMALGDYFPFLRWLTYFGVEKKLLNLHIKKDAITQALLDAHRNSKKSTDVETSGSTIVDMMLKLQESEPEFYTDDVIKGIMQSMLTAGTHTTVITMTLVISHLLSHPDVIEKAREEIDNHVGQSRLVNDADLPKLAYLRGIINETLRITTKAVLPPRESSEECKIAGYDIPQGTQLFVNVSAVHRDPNLWTDPDVFNPERFQDIAEEKEGCKFLSFGVGRRICPGASLAMRVMELSLGTFIQCFEWENGEDEVDRVGAVKTKGNMPMDTSVKIIFRPREALVKVLDQL